MGSSIGYFADIAIIDLDTFADKGTYLDPFVYSAGVKSLVVNGVIEIKDGNFTDKLGGRPCLRSEY